MLQQLLYSGWVRISGLFCVLMILPSTALAFDAKQAEKTYKKCRACHEVGVDASNRVGPNLNGLSGKAGAAVAGYSYSNALRKYGEEGGIWNAETLDQFLEKPKKFIKGVRMSFAGIKDEEERSNLIQWLLDFGPDGKRISDAPEFKNTASALLGQTAAALEGDPEYGEYLSGECVTCHRISGNDDGIPSIVGWPKEDFIHALYEYKNQIRKNPVMRTLSKRLGDEEMAALAAYFGSLETQ